MLVMHVALFNELACVAHWLLHALARAQAEISLEQSVACRADAKAAKRPAGLAGKPKAAGLQLERLVAVTIDQAERADAASLAVQGFWAERCTGRP